MTYTLVIPGNESTYPPDTDADILEAFVANGVSWSRIIRARTMRPLCERSDLGERHWMPVPAPTTSPNPLVDLLFEVVLWSCTIHHERYNQLNTNTSVAYSILDSAGIPAYAEALRLLAQHGLITIESDDPESHRIVARYAQGDKSS